MQPMTLEYQTLIDTCNLWTDLNCDRENPYIKMVLEEISRAIHNVMAQRYRELHPDARSDTVLPVNMEITPDMLLKIQTHIDQMMAEETIAHNFADFLSPRDRDIFIELCGLHTSFCDDATVFFEKIRTDIVPRLTPGTPLNRAIHLILSGINMKDALYRVFKEGGGKLTPTERPPGIIDFIARFRGLVMRAIAETQGPVVFQPPSITQAFEIN